MKQTGVFEDYDSLPGVWLDTESAALGRTGEGISDIFSHIAAKLISEGVKKEAEKAGTAATEARARKAGEKAAEYAR